MPKLEYFLVCESMSTDRETNRVSLFNVLDELRIRGPETTQPQGIGVTNLVAVCCWNREPGDEEKDLQGTLRVYFPGQQAKDLSINFTMERPRHRLSFRLEGIPKLEPGELKFELLLNGNHVAWHTVNVLPPTSDSADAG